MGTVYCHIAVPLAGEMMNHISVWFGTAAFLALPTMNLQCAAWLECAVVLLSESPGKVRYLENQQGMLKLYELIESSSPQSWTTLEVISFSLPAWAGHLEPSSSWVLFVVWSLLNLVFQTWNVQKCIHCKGRGGVCLVLPRRKDSWSPYIWNLALLQDTVNITRSCYL